MPKGAIIPKVPEVDAGHISAWKALRNPSSDINHCLRLVGGVNETAIPAQRLDKYPCCSQEMASFCFSEFLHLNTCGVGSSFDRQERNYCTGWLWDEPSRTDAVGLAPSLVLSFPAELAWWVCFAVVKEQSAPSSRVTQHSQNITTSTIHKASLKQNKKQKKTKGKENHQKPPKRHSIPLRQALMNMEQYIPVSVAVASVVWIDNEPAAVRGNIPPSIHAPSLPRGSLRFWLSSFLDASVPSCMKYVRQSAGSCTSFICCFSYLHQTHLKVHRTQHRKVWLDRMEKVLWSTDSRGNSATGANWLERDVHGDEFATTNQYGMHMLLLWRGWWSGEWALATRNKREGNVISTNFGCLCVCVCVCLAAFVRARLAYVASDKRSIRRTLAKLGQLTIGLIDCRPYRRGSPSVPDS